MAARRAAWLPMVLDVLNAEYAGGGPGFVLVRVTGRARTRAAVRLAPPTLLVADGPRFRRLATVHGTAPLQAGPGGPAFSVDVEVPLHLAWTPGGWWLEPGPALHDGDRLDELRQRVAALAAEVAALRARVSVEPDTAAATGPLGDGRPSAEAVALPRPLLRRLRPTLPALMVAAGALAVGDAVATVVWQEPISGLYAMREQHALDGDLARLDRSVAQEAPALPSVSPDVRMRAIARTLETTEAGRPLGKLTIPRIDASYVVVQGTRAGSLRRGPGHYSGTALPGEPGTVGIAGHRTTYGAPFRHLDALRRGDAIEVRMPYGSFRYRVEGTRIVAPRDVSVLANAGRQRLVLTACHPLYSAAQRIVVLARLERAVPRGPAVAPAPAPAPTPAAAPRGGDVAARGPRA